MAAIPDVVITSRVPLGNYWMVSGYGTAPSGNSYLEREDLGFDVALHVVYVNGRSTTPANNITGATINSTTGVDSSRGNIWIGATATVVTDFCVIGR